MSEREEVLKDFLSGWGTMHCQTPDVNTVWRMADEIAALRSQLAAVEQTRVKALQSVLDGLTQMTEMRDREQHRATTAERERDEARWEREVMESERDRALQEVAEAEAECESLRHRAERAERVVEAAREFVDAGYGGEDDDAEWTALHEAVRALDAAEGTA